MSFLPPHPDRAAVSLAARSGPVPEPCQLPGPDSASARVDLAQLWWRAERAAQEHPPVAAYLANLRSPDLRAGTVQDVTARGLQARLEEALSLCPAPPVVTKPAADESQVIAEGRQTKVFDGKELRRKREILIASKGPRLRVSRRDGLQLIDRAQDLNIPHCIELEDREDQGCLDRFVPREDRRARVFSPAHLQRVYLAQGPAHDLLVLRGRLGGARRAFPTELQIFAYKDQAGVALRLRIDNQHGDHRLRIRFAALRDDGYVRHDGTPEWRESERHGHRRLSATLLRATGRLRVGADFVATPAAQLRGWIEHRFVLGGDLDLLRWPCGEGSAVVDNRR